MDWRCLLIPALTVAGAPGAFAQDSADKKSEVAITNPPGFVFVLKTRDAGRSTFHLGEMIEIEEDYASLVPGQYLLAQNPAKLEGGAAPNLKIAPEEGVVNRVRETGWVSAAAILHAHCGEGIGVGGAGSCGDCGGKYKLGKEPIHFPYFLNYRFAITKPGRYTLQVTAANIVEAGNEDKAIAVASNKLEIEIVQDEAWSHQQLEAATSRYEEAGRKFVEHGWDKADARSIPGPEESQTGQELESAAEIIRFLHTEESLREAVCLYDGSPRTARYENTFLKAILESSHRDEVVQLLAKRMVDEDFLASEQFVDLLTAMTIQVEEPVVFARHDLASLRQLNPRTRQILRDYLVALGESLPSKHDEARALGVTTFKNYAADDYCTGHPLIEKRLADRILGKAGSK